MEISGLPEIWKRELGLLQPRSFTRRIGSPEKEMVIDILQKTIQAEELQSLDQPQLYSGHTNLQTVNGVRFFEPSDEFVTSGPDCGHIYIRKKRNGRLMLMMLWTPMAKILAHIPKYAEEMMAANKQGRDARGRATISPDVLMRILVVEGRIILSPLGANNPTAADSDSDSTPAEGLSLRSHRIQYFLRFSEFIIEAMKICQRKSST